MTLLSKLALEDLSPSRLWQQLDPDTRRLAARAMYEGQRDQGGPGRREADAAIARALRFREVAVRKLPLAKRIDTLALRVFADEPLASSLLLALHMEYRSATLGKFLDRLGIPHDRGAIDENHDLQAPDAETLRPAVEHAYAECPTDEVDLYLASLLALDRDTWGALEPLLRDRTLARRA